MSRARALVAVLLVLLLAAPASAAPPDLSTVASRLRQDPLYVDAASTVVPDAVAVRAALAGTPVPTYVAVLPQASADAEELGVGAVMLRVLEEVQDPTAVVLVVTDGEELQAGAGPRSGFDADAALDKVLTSRLDEPFGPRTLTGALVEFAELVRTQVRPAPVPSTSRRTVGLVGLAVTALLAGGLVLGRRRRAAPDDAAGGAPDGGGWAPT